MKWWTARGRVSPNLLMKDIANLVEVPGIATRVLRGTVKSFYMCILPIEIHPTSLR